MSNKKTWSRYLNEVFGCGADEYGNRPCDWGCPCDRCSTKEVTENYNKWKEEGEKEC